VLNKIANKRVSLSSIFLQFFVTKHPQMLAVITEVLCGSGKSFSKTGMAH